MTRFSRTGTAALLCFPLLGAALSGCDTVSGWFGKSEKTPLAGERVAVLAGERKVQADARLASLRVTVPAAVTNEMWPQAGGYPDHAMGNLALSAQVAPVWKADAGTAGNSERLLMSAPVVVNGRVYTMDGASRVSAFDATNGQALWRIDTRPENERGDTTGGGVAFGEGRIYAATGYGEVLALDPANGSVVWRKHVPGPVRGAPTISAGRVFAVTLDNQTAALSATDGNSLWTHTGIVETVGILGGVSPAVSGNLVIVPYSSGELYGLRPDSGRVVWSESLATLRRGAAMAGLADIRAMPVVDRGLVVAVGHGGRTIGIDERVGNRLWEQEIGGTQTPWSAGDFIYVLTNDNELVALTRQNGRVRWVTALERFRNPDRKQGRLSWAGPTMAGGRLWLTGSNGELLAVSPETGQVESRTPLAGPTYLPPVVAGNTLYVLSDNATVTAFR
jgi:outer membrane protein assembly factor BamB